MAYDLRPLSLAELLDRSFSLYRRHFWVFVGIMAPPSIAMLLLSLGSNAISGVQALAPEFQPSPEMGMALAIGVILLTLVTFLLYWITYALAVGATTSAVSEIYTGETPSIAAAFRAIKGRLGRLTWLLFLLGVRLVGIVLIVMVTTVIAATAAGLVAPALGAIGFGVGMFAAFGVFVWMFLRYAVCVPAAILEENTASDAIARSIDLTTGSLLKVLVLLVFTVIVTYAALAIFQMPFAIAAFVVGLETPAGFGLNMLGVITGSVASALTSPLAVVAMAVLYYDLRIRHEGLDLELMVAKLREAAPPASGQAQSTALPG
jgi:hypothetical protein